MLEQLIPTGHFVEESGIVFTQIIMPFFIPPLSSLEKPKN